MVGVALYIGCAISDREGLCALHGADIPNGGNAV